MQYVKFGTRIAWGQRGERHCMGIVRVMLCTEIVVAGVVVFVVVVIGRGGRWNGCCLIGSGVVVSPVVLSRLLRGPGMWERVRVRLLSPIGTLRGTSRLLVMGCQLVVGGLALGKSRR